MQFSASTLGALVALPALASAINSFNATFHAAPGCKDPKPLYLEGTSYTNCIALNETISSVSGFEDKEIGYCHWFLFTDKNCTVGDASYNTLDGHCEDFSNIKSVRASCYR